MIFKTTNPATPVMIDYTNYQGKREQRMINPMSVFWGHNKWHPEPQWLMEAWCHKAKDNRFFALKDIHQWNLPIPRS